MIQLLRVQSTIDTIENYSVIAAEEIITTTDYFMRLLLLFYEFFKVGLFSVGGGLATIPFLQDLGTRTQWYTQGELANMIAVSESTPGPMGINMASYVGYSTAGMLGAVVATLGTIFPALFIIMLIAKILNKFQNSPTVQGIFYGLRPASAALIFAAALQVAEVGFTRETELGNILFPAAVALALAIWGLMHHSPLSKLHPVFFIALSGLVGIFFQF